MNSKCLCCPFKIEKSTTPCYIGFFPIHGKSLIKNYSKNKKLYSPDMHRIIKKLPKNKRKTAVSEIRKDLSSIGKNIIIVLKSFIEETKIEPCRKPYQERIGRFCVLKRFIEEKGGVDKFNLFLRNKGFLINCYQRDCPISPEREYIAIDHKKFRLVEYFDFHEIPVYSFDIDDADTIIIKELLD